MEKDGAFPNDFPTDGVELRCFLVVSNYARSLAFYRDVLGARVLHELPGTLCFLSFAGSQILLSAPFGSRSDQPDVPDPLPPNEGSVISELSIRVPDCSAAYQVLRSRGASFLAPPFAWSDETRAFFHDPDGHLLEIWEARKVEVSSQ
jgi:catechol 2,3-dioxygenase-like lactoylglutathione lyase family enzyme